MQRPYIYFIAYGFIGSIVSVACGDSVPFFVHALINPAFYIYFAFTLSFNPLVVQGAALSIAINTLFFGLMGYGYKAKGRNLHARILWYILVFIYALNACMMIVTEIF